MAGLAQRRPQPLPRHLQQAEPRQSADLDTRPIHANRIAQPVLDIPLILGRLHIDEIDDDQSANVADAQLAGNLVSRLEIRVERGRLDIAAARGTRRVDVNRDEGLGVVNDDTAAGGQLDFVRVGRLDLALDLKSRKERNIVLIELQALLGVRRHEARHVLLRLLEGGRFVDQHFAYIVGQVVAHGAGDGVALAEDQKRGRAVLGGRVDLFPLGLEIVEVPLQLLDRASDARGADDRTHAVGNLQLAHHLAHLVAVFAFDAS